MNKRKKSQLRAIINKARRNLIRNKKTQKILAVRYNNLKVLMNGNKKPVDTTFDYKAIIAGPQRFYCDEKYHGNIHYGISKVIKDYAGIRGSLNCCIEHGVYFGNYVSEDEAIDSGFPKLLTFGQQRVEHLSKVANVEVIPIGPYIHYAVPSLSEDDIKEIKKKNGNTLLVFPTHSIDRVDMEFDMELFIENIKKFQDEHDFKTVIVCLFYKDIMLGRDKDYENKGYQVVTAGYMDDPMFLNRLKSFILLSDYTISNDVGTHVGYCISLGKPHFIFNQTIKPRPYTKNDLESVTTTFNSSAVKEKAQVKEVFSSYSSNITKEQIDIVDKYWGLSFLRDSKELNKLVVSCS